MVFQIQNNWTYGEVLDENAKTHPMLRPYKTFSEKVRVLQLGIFLKPNFQKICFKYIILSVFFVFLNLRFLWASGQGDLPLAH